MRTALAPLLAISVIVGTLIPGLSAEAETCVDYEVIAARGSGAAPLGSTTEADYEEDFNSGMGIEGNRVYTDLVQEMPDATFAPWGVRYPATWNLSERFGGINLDYSQSIRVGGEAIKEEIERQYAACPGTRFILSGYSQGADAIAAGIDELTPTQRDLVAATVFFGDVHFNPGDVATARGNFSADHWGVFGARAKWGTKLDSPVFSYCRDYDPACNIKKNSTMNGIFGPWTMEGTDVARITGHATDTGAGLFAEHEKYVSGGYASKAAVAVAKTLGKPCVPPVGGYDRPVVLTGSVKATVGQSLVYSAVDTAVNECDAVAFGWSVNSQEVSVSGVTQTAQLDLATGAKSTIPDGQSTMTEEPPTDEGPYLEKTFSEPGTYLVEVAIPNENGETSASIEVTVVPAPTVAPPSPVLSTTTVDGTTTLRWRSGDGPPAELYSIIDGSGDAIEHVIPAGIVNDLGQTYYEYEVTAALPAGGPPYSVQAVNSVGVTPATLAMTAASATYEHQIESSTQIDGRRLALNGPMSADLEHLRDTATAPGTVVGTYSAVFSTAAGDAFSYDMIAAVAHLTLGPTNWELSFEFGDDTDSNGMPVWQIMRDGFAGSLLSSGSIGAEFSGQKVLIQIDDDTVVTEENKYTIAKDVGAPEGVSVDDSDGWQSLYTSMELLHHGTFDPSLFPVVGEVQDLESTDWYALDITDVRTYIGDDEITNTGEVEVWHVAEAISTEEETIGLDFYGVVGDGSYLTMRSFVRSGALSFRVNGGAPNVLELRATPEAAQEQFPAPVAPEFTVASDMLAGSKYRYKQWRPDANWGMDGEGSFAIDGNIPGLSFDGVELFGEPTESGTFQFTIDATNATGTTSREYTLEVGSAYADPRYYISVGTSIQRQSDGTFKIYFGRSDYVRLDNPNMTQWWPALAESGIADGERPSETTQFTAQNFKMYKLDGTQILVTGIFTVTMSHSAYGKTPLTIRSSNAVFGNNTAATVNAIWSATSRITFTRADGSLNEVWRTGYNPRVT